MKKRLIEIENRLKDIVHSKRNDLGTNEKGKPYIMNKIELESI